MTYDPIQPAPADAASSHDADSYDAGAAAFHLFAHARRTGWAPLLKLGAFYLVVGIGLTVLALASMWPFLALAMESGAGAMEPEPVQFLQALGRGALVCGLVMAASVLVWVMVDAALLRWLFGRGMRLRLGGAELRMIAIGVFWLLLPLLIFLLPGVLMAVAGGMQSVGLILVATLLLIAAVFVWAMLSVRFAAAAARTVHDGHLRVFSAWEVTRGRFWAVLGAFLIGWLVYFGASILVQTVIQVAALIGMGAALGPLMMMSPEAEPDPAAIMAVFASTGFVAILVVYVALSCVLGFLFQAMMAGVNAYGVKRLAGQQA